MRPLDVAKSMYLDYTTTQSIKFYNKGVEKLPGEPFNGKLLLTWLIPVQDKPMCTHGLQFSQSKANYLLRTSQR